MKQWPGRVRALVRRERAHSYVLIVLLSFAGTVSGTRLFLELTGYPQIGHGSLHIAHVLWGGLLLFAACLLLLITANRWALLLGAVLGGIGMGFFMDEIGKFITASNDYFFPAAAPIVYAFFLLTIMVYLQIRRPQPVDSRTELYRVLDQVSELLDSDLQQSELLETRHRLEQLVEREQDPALVQLAQSLLGFLGSPAVRTAPANPGLLERAAAAIERLQQQWLTQARLRWILTTGLMVLAASSTLNLIRLSLGAGQPEALEAFILQLIESKPVAGFPALNGYLVQTGVQAAAGLLCLLAAVLLLFSRFGAALNLAYYGLLLNLTIGNVLIFYFEQFSTILPAALQFVLLLGVLDFRSRFSSSLPPAA